MIEEVYEVNSTPMKLFQQKAVNQIIVGADAVVANTGGSDRIHGLQNIISTCQRHDTYRIVAIGWGEIMPLSSGDLLGE